MHIQNVFGSLLIVMFWLSAIGCIDVDENPNTATTAKQPTAPLRIQSESHLSEDAHQIDDIPHNPSADDPLAHLTDDGEPYAYEKIETAMMYGDLLDVYRYIIRGADVNQQVANGMLIHSTVYLGTTEIVHLLVANGADVNARDSTGQTPLHLVADDASELATFLIAKGAHVSATCQLGDTPLYAAVAGGKPAIARILIEHGADVHVRNARNQWSLLEMAVSRNDAAVAAVLLSNGLDPNEKDESGSTPLHHAARYGRIEVMQVLIEHGADVNALGDRGKTPLHAAVSGIGLSGAISGVSGDQRKAIELLIENGAAIDATDEHGSTPLHSAVLMLGRAEAAVVLINSGASINHRDDWQRTPLHTAASGTRQMVEILVRAGADMNATDKDGWTPLAIASDTNNRQVAAFLRDNGAFYGNPPKRSVSSEEGAVKSSRPPAFAVTAVMNSRDGRYAMVARRYGTNNLTITRMIVRVGDTLNDSGTEWSVVGIDSENQQVTIQHSESGVSHVLALNTR